MYYVVGDLSGWTFAEMQADEGNAVFRYQFSLGEAGVEEFQIVANQDWNQKFYPDKPAAAPGRCMVCGPDKGGHDLNWRVTGHPGTRMEVILDLSAEDKRKTVLVTSMLPAGKYYVVASWNDWSFQEMEPDRDDPEVVRGRFTLTKGVEAEFQIVYEQNWDYKLYPDVPGADPDESSLVGPDNLGHGKNWKVICATGEEMEITLNLCAESRRKMVSCGRPRRD